MPDRWCLIKEIPAYIGISRDAMLNCITQKNSSAHEVWQKQMPKSSEMDEWVKKDNSKIKINGGTEWKIIY